MFATTLTADEVQSSTISGLQADGYPTDAQSLNTCAAPSSSYPTLATACPADAIQSVGIDLRVAKPGTSSSGVVDDHLIVYRYAQSPGSTVAPYQYSEAQG